MDYLIFEEKLSIAPSPPFNFELSAQIFSDGDEQIRRFEKDTFWQVIRIEDKLALGCVKSIGTVEKPNVKIELKTNCKLTEEDREKARKTVSYLFNLEFDLSEFYKEARKDQTMARLTKKLRGLKSPTTQFAFEALVDSIVEQQISLKVANAFERRMIKRWGDNLSLDGKTYFAYPTPKRLASASLHELREVGLSERKSEYIRNVASLVSEGKFDLESLRRTNSVGEIVQDLDDIKGIGLWTAELTMLRGMQKLEVLPADDLGLKRTISRYYCSGKSITSYEAREIAKQWGKWKGLAAYYLIVAEILGITP